MVTKAERAKMELERLESMRAFDCQKRDGCRWIIGVDEVGRGPLAGPVVACAAAMPQDWNILGINDSKKVSEKRRRELAKEINQKSSSLGLGFVNSKRIDRFNILNATKMAMLTAVKKCIENLPLEETNRGDIPCGTICRLSESPLQSDSCEGSIKILIDGNIKIPLESFSFNGIKVIQETVIKGDGKSLSIGAASIFAKVARDEFMKSYGEKYPEYGFSKHKGYGTKEHYKAIESFGISPIHRKSFLKKVLEKMEEELI
ncbi:ribonuclease HII [Eubacteriales bacterium KG127]